jgi:hypothetical protein
MSVDCIKNPPYKIKMLIEFLVGFRPSDATLAAVFICAECHTRFPSHAELRQHLLSCINPKRQPRVQLLRLTGNQLLAHKVPSEQIGELFLKSKELECSICELQFTDSNSFDLHVAVHRLVSDIKRKRNELFKNLAPSGETLTCSHLHCSYTSKTARNLKMHQKRMHNLISSKRADPVLFECKFCGCNFMTLNHFNLHLKRHKTEKPGFLKCLHRQCSQFFSSAIELRKHWKNHKVEKFPCKTCGRFYQSAFLLRKHMVRHLDKRPFRCQVAGCSYAGKLKNDLGNHKRNGHDNVGFTCHLCGKSVKHLRFFKEHVKLHETGTFGVFKCFSFYSCKGLTFSSTAELKDHMLTNHNLEATTEQAVTSFACTFPSCCKQFISLKSLCIHKSIAHSSLKLADKK